MFEELKTIKLDYLESMGGEEIIVELLKVYIDQVPDFEKGIQDHFENKNWIELSHIAHKTKGSISILGMDSLAVDLKKLQIICEFLERNKLLEEKTHAQLDEKQTKLLDQLMEKRLDSNAGIPEPEINEIEDEIDRFNEGKDLVLVPQIVHRSIDLLHKSKNEVNFVLNQLS